MQFFSAFSPYENNLDKPINLDGFCMFFGHTFANSDDRSGYGFFQNHNTVGEIKEGEAYFPDLEADIYFTPNLFVDKKPRSTFSLAWLTSIYIDIDGIFMAYDTEEGVNRVRRACRQLEIPQPNIIIRTSDAKSPHLHLYWLLDPIYVPGNREEYIKYWKDSTRAVIEGLESYDPDLNIDRQASCNPAGFMRVPHTIHQSTEQVVRIVDINTEKRHLLGDGWLRGVRREHNPFTSYKEKPRRATRHPGADLLKHPQISALRKGVPEGYRNRAQWALAKACFADGLSVDEALEVVHAQNENCAPPEQGAKVTDVVMRVYGLYGPESYCFYNISPEKLCATVNGAFGTSFEPDPEVYHKFRASLNRRKSPGKKYLSKSETVRKTLVQIFRIIRTGFEYLPTQRVLATMAGVSKSSMSKYFAGIKRFLSCNLGIEIVRIGRSNRLKIVCTEHTERRLLRTLQNTNSCCIGSVVDWKELEVLGLEGGAGGDWPSGFG